MLILEDDALLSTRAPAFLAALSGISHVEHVSLETRARKKLIGKHHSRVGEGLITPLIQDRTGAAAYVLWPQGARRLCTRAQYEGGALADAFISNFYELLSFQSLPAFAIQSDMAKWYGVVSRLKTHSYIQQHTHKADYKAHGMEGWKFKKIRIASQVKQALRYISHIYRANRSLVPLDFTGFTPFR